ncbi:putative ubiquitin-conjugating enzyme [Phaeomoniella chlamydospora]|uniref:Putative ubiquitin-conjugating enzyme n=1 Tax=Phaeomoniella chlamydospora TaxID=158046 RepID=A0A0G2E7P8_PHACM|nr:putative ubiquitin-conjugating enzyme [Phaeomoniella chlamydospora]
MATKQATKRLTREYQDIQKNPPPYIVAHPSENNILEWHYILTGPPNTPYEGGQYWGSLVFPSDYPFAPPAIRMHTPSGRFQPSTRLCLSISDFHPKQWNPAWTVSTALVGLLSFMTSEEITTGSIAGTEAERKWYAARSRWWNATGGGSSTRTAVTGQAAKTQPGNVKAGDGGAKFRSQWPELDEENWQWMKDNHIDPVTGKAIVLSDPATVNACSPETAALRKRLGATTTTGVGAVVHGGQAARNAGNGWLGRNKIWFAAGLVFTYVLVSRLVVEGDI